MENIIANVNEGEKRVSCEKEQRDLSFERFAPAAHWKSMVLRDKSEVGEHIHR